MKRMITTLALAATMVLAGASVALAGPTCSNLGFENHGAHVKADYVKGENANAKGGATLPGGPGPGFHFPNGVAPGASFCTDSNSPGLHP